MDLVPQIVANLEVEEGQAEKGVGAILMALRMIVDKPTFEKVKAAVPNHESYMGRALMSTARLYRNTRIHRSRSWPVLS